MSARLPFDEVTQTRDAAVASHAAEPQLPATIRLAGLSVFAHHGIAAEERALGQRFEFDIEVDVPHCAACRTDDPRDSVAYEAIIAVVVEVATNFRFTLMEALAEAVCTELLVEFPISAVRCAVSKTEPSMPHVLAHATVRIERHRADLVE